MRFTVFDRWGNQTGTVPDVIEAVHADEVNGEDSLTLLLPACDLSKGDRIVWRDRFLVWHEHTVNDIKAVHQDGKAYSTVYCESSLAELWTDYLEDVRNRDVTATVAMGKALSKSRWEVGRVEIPKVATTSYYHESAREALNDIVKAYGGELSVSVAVEGTGIASRKVSLLKRRGEDSGKRFEYSKDIKGITREVAVDDVCTALYGYGKGLEQVSDDGHPTGGYDRKLTFGDINGGKDYVADEKAKERWGLPDGKGGKKHCFGKVEFSDCEDKTELKALTLAELEKRKAPRVTYEADVVDLADAGFAGEDVRPGDVVALIDRDLGERLVGRVLRVERYLYNEQATKITIGNASRRITDVLAQTKSQLDSLNSRSGTWDGMARLSEGYMQRLVSSLNNTMNQTGGYTYMEPGEGIVTYDRPKDQNPTMAIQIKGAGFRIANTKKANGDWDWRTFGTAAGFTADEINAGTIRGELLVEPRDRGHASWAGLHPVVEREPLEPRRRRLPDRLQALGEPDHLVSHDEGLLGDRHSGRDVVRHPIRDLQGVEDADREGREGHVRGRFQQELRRRPQGRRLERLPSRGQGGDVRLPVPDDRHHQRGQPWSVVR